MFGITRSRLKYIAFLATIGILISVFDRFLTLTHWVAIDFNVISYNPWLPLVGFVGVSVYLSIAYLKRAYWYFWASGLMWMTMEFIMLFAVFKTYGNVFGLWIFVPPIIITILFTVVYKIRDGGLKWL